MANDAKLGMFAGVLGVIVAAVLFTDPPPPVDPARPVATVVPPATAQPASLPTASAAVPLPSTPIARTRKEVDAVPTARQVGADDEP